MVNADMMDNVIERERERVDSLPNTSRGSQGNPYLGIRYSLQTGASELIRYYASSVNSNKHQVVLGPRKDIC